MTVETLLHSNGDQLRLDAARSQNLRFPSPRGGIEARAGATVLLSGDLADDLTDLWTYVLNGLDAVVEGRGYETYYPSYPVRIRIAEVEPRMRTRHLRIEVGTGEASAYAVVAWKDAVGALARGASRFAEAMQTLDLAHARSYASLEQRARSIAERAGDDQPWHRPR